VTCCSAYCCMFRNSFIFCVTAGGKHALEGKNKPSYKCTVIGLAMKIRMVHTSTCEGGQSLFAVACELGFVVSTVNPIMKDATCIKVHPNFQLIHACLSVKTVFNMSVL
jgi:hypothetical protein